MGNTPNPMNQGKPYVSYELTDSSKQYAHLKVDLGKKLLFS